MQKSFFQVICDNFIYLITGLLAIGTAIMIFKQQACAIENNQEQTVAISKKVNQLEIGFIKLDIMKDDIKDIKSEIRDIKRIILKPAIGNNNSNSNSNSINGILASKKD